jgi:hypothetical protein
MGQETGLAFMVAMSMDLRSNNRFQATSLPPFGRQGRA